jgi:hypothetical protein
LMDETVLNSPGALPAARPVWTGGFNARHSGVNGTFYLFANHHPLII